jgi:serine/threonine protein kinase
MGTVFLGVRDDDAFQKRVAVKVLKRGTDTDAVVRRFRHERLDHPYIAGLLDGGTTPDGLPYFAMEYIEGQPIVEYCERHIVRKVPSRGRTCRRWKLRARSWRRSVRNYASSAGIAFLAG